MERPKECDLFETFFLKMLLDMLHSYMHSRGCVYEPRRKKIFSKFKVILR